MSRQPSGQFWRPTPALLRDSFGGFHFGMELSARWRRWKNRMAVLKRRNRMVNFRLSEEEYDRLKSLCVTEGARSISDFARSAVCRSLSAVPAALEEPLAERMRKLDGRVEELDRTIKQLVHLMKNTFPANDALSVE